VLLRRFVGVIWCAFAFLVIDIRFDVANAQARLEAAYTATLLGIPIGDLSWTIDIQQHQFSAAASGGTAGILQLFSEGHGTTSARGAISGGRPNASSFSLSMFSGHWSKEVRVLFRGGRAEEHVSIQPPGPNPPPSLPLTEAHRTGAVDPITALLIRVPGSGDTAVPEACERTLPIFDGQTRFDLELAFKRLESVTTDEGYRGTVVVCSARFSPLGGYDPDRVLLKYLAGERGIELWLAPIAGSRLLVPYRITIPTPVGLGVVRAVKFVASPNPA
jgi:hypothetical protein